MAKKSRDNERIEKKQEAVTNKSGGQVAFGGLALLANRSKPEGLPYIIMKLTFIFNLL